MSGFDKDSFKTILSIGFIGCVFSLIFLSYFNYKLPPFLVGLSIALCVFHFVSYIIQKNKLIYFLKRIFGLFVLLFVIASIVFVMLRFLPGGPFDREKALPPEIQANISAKYNLNAPLYEQFFIYIKNILKGDFGQSYKYLEKDVTEIIKETLPISIQLGIYALILAYLLGVPLGIYSASRHNRWQDRLAMITAISGIALPSFLIAPVFILFFGFYLGWFEVALWEGPSHYTLPVLVLGIRPAGVIARFIRADILDILHSDYIRTARAKGLHPFVVFYKHTLKNAFIPALTFSGPLVAGLLTGSFIIEQIFAINGMGKHFILSVTNRDYPLIMAVTLVYCSILVLCNLIVDILYSYFDPRIKIS